eukprot:TRINITY_DN15438_c0_g1_i1.p1 TRINITY_DN15438_c0_g1~~TRINITY_DN15438_c0_g1_i1.p1  ORF type:complete len:190 (-),score=40.12 TRINITY_DN15438_c0_g1_i1:115-684(-)
MSSVYRVVLVGEGGVGKSCLTIQFINEKFVEEYDPTMEDSYRKQVTVDNEECLLDIFDTAGQEDFSAVRDQYMRTGDGFLCVYSIILSPSFASVRNFHDHILRVKDKDELPFILVGNKADLESERVVSKSEGEKLSQELNCRFMETSAKTRQNVCEIFHELVREIKKWRAKYQDEEVIPIKKKKGCQLI